VLSAEGQVWHSAESGTPLLSKEFVEQVRLDAPSIDLCAVALHLACNSIRPGRCHRLRFGYFVTLTDTNAVLPKGASQA
jgi:hypothetical protein